MYIYNSIIPKKMERNIKQNKLKATIHIRTNDFKLLISDYSYFNYYVIQKCIYLSKL